MATDSTPVKDTLVMYNRDKEYYLLAGADHPPFKPVRITYYEKDEREEGVINGIENVTKLKREGELVSATKAYAVILTPLCNQSFNYVLLVVPDGSQLKSGDMREMYVKIVDLAAAFNMEVRGEVADGDSRQRCNQNNHYVLNFPPSYYFLTKLEFPFKFGLGCNGDIALSDCLHVLKKLRNNCKYLSTRYLLFCDVKDLTADKHETYAVTWDLVLKLWTTSDHFRDQVSKSCVGLGDKQDPSLVTELCFCFNLFYSHGFNGMGLFLEVIYMTFCAIYDQSISPEIRVLHASTARTTLILWHEAMKSQKCVGMHFITLETYKDTICLLEGTILYILYIVIERPDCEIVPEFFTSDSCEQFYAALRTGRHRGRQTNLSYMDILEGAIKSNRTLSLDAEGFHLLKTTLAHTRGRTLIPRPSKKKTYLGKDTTLNKIKEAIKNGFLLARANMEKYSGFSCLSEESLNDLCIYQEEEPEEEMSDLEDLTDTIEVDIASYMEDEEKSETGLPYLAKSGKMYHKQTAETKFLNGGRSSQPAQPRVRRVHCSVSPYRLTMEHNCTSQDDQDPCSYITAGSTGIFTVKKGPVKENSTEGCVCLIFIGIGSQDPDRSSVSHHPIDRICRKHESALLWVKTNSGHVVLCYS